LAALWRNICCASRLFEPSVLGVSADEQVIFTPLLAAWSIWVGIAISTRTSDIRAAQQLSTLANLPLVALTTLIAFNVIQPTLGLALAFGAGLLVIDRLGWRIVSAMFDRERLIAGTR
jgi:hypothetical protein